MVNISKALNSGQVRDYHKKEFTNAQENYYTEQKEVTGQWRGELAREWGLVGDVAVEQFTRLAEGQDPKTGEQLIRHRLASSYENEDGTTVKSVAHRAGWDATFQAPKSVSVTALVAGDERIRQAHQRAVAKALDYMERHVQARIGGNTAPELTGKWAVATFEHDSARPVDGFAAPQLHTHAVFFNITKTEDQKAHALQERNLFKVQGVATAIYQAELAYSLRQLGYELDAGKNGAPEIKGYSQEYLEANSPRSAQIQQRMQELEAQGIIPAARTSDAGAREIAAHATRAAKAHYTREQMQAINRALAQQFGNQHENVLAAARRRAQEHDQTLDPKVALAAAAQAVTYARDKSFEHEAVVSERELLRNALERGRGITRFDDIEAAFAQRQEQRSLLPMKGRHNELAYTTPEMLRLEKENIQLMRNGARRHNALAAQHTLDHKALNRLNPNQKVAALEILSSRDTVQALQGAAGTGKTYTLTVVREHLERNGYEVRGLAPTSRATRQLAECGAECSTLQKHLSKPTENTVEKGGKTYRLDTVIEKGIARETQTELKPVVYLVDETSLASTNQVNGLLKGLHSNDRVIMIGDVRQHEAVEAGRSFAQLQEHGIHTARLDQIVRQKDPSLKEAVELLADNRVPESVGKLKQQGRVTEIATERDRFQTIAQEYLKAPESTLVVSPDNRSRAAINGLVHEELRQAGALTGPDHAVTVHVTRQDISGADRKWAARYEVGNVLRYRQGSVTLRLDQGEYVTVKKVDTDANQITVTRKDATDITYDPARLCGVSVYRSEQRSFATGDRIQFTTPFADHKVANRELGTITAFTKTGDLTIALDSGRTVTFNPRDYAHLDHGYAVTSHSSQGLTTDRVLVNIDASSTNPNLVNNRLAYVAISRGRYDAHVYTNNASTLEYCLSRDVSKTSALAPPEQTQEYAQQQSQTPPTLCEMKPTDQVSQAHVGQQPKPPNHGVGKSVTHAISQGEGPHSAPAHPSPFKGRMLEEELSLDQGQGIE
jgi:conjugative relaxase-like TrwC/TraI family protein